MSINDRIKLYDFSMGLKPFQVFDILSIFDLETIITSKDILADEIDFEKVLILLLFSYLLICHKQSNALINLYVISSCY